VWLLRTTKIKTHDQNEQVVKVIWHKTALPQQMDGSIVITGARCHQRASHEVTLAQPGKYNLTCAFFSLPESTKKQVFNPNGISIGSVIFAGLTTVTDRQSDHATRSITIGRIYVRSTAMRPNRKQPSLIHNINTHKSSYSHAVIRSNNHWSVCNASVECMSNGIKLHPPEQHVTLPAVMKVFHKTRANTTILRTLYRTTCISRHHQLRTAGFCCLYALADR